MPAYQDDHDQRPEGRGTDKQDCTEIEDLILLGESVRILSVTAAR